LKQTGHITYYTTICRRCSEIGLICTLLDHGYLTWQQ